MLFGQKYKEQFAQQFGNIMPELSYEIALATKKIVEECERTSSSHIFSSGTASTFTIRVNTYSFPQSGHAYVL